MPSSRDRQRLEVRTTIYERLQEIAETEDRTVASVVHDLLLGGLRDYQAVWIPSKHLPRLTPAARAVLPLAEAEAYRLNHDYIGTEHLLLGLLREGEDVAAGVLRDLGVDLAGAREAVVARIGPVDAPFQSEIDYTLRARRALGLTVAEAERLGHRAIGTAHLLLGLLVEEKGMACQVLDDLGVLGRVREQTLARLGIAVAPDAASESAAG
jgi:ATP-dependent Clp protease ATP-binding subunit ClpC